MTEYRVRVSGISSRVDQDMIQKSFGKVGMLIDVALKGSTAILVRLVRGRS